MADTREQILLQLVAIANSVAPTEATRNVDDMTASSQLAITILDGDEAPGDNFTPIRSSRGDPRVLLELMSMTPSVLLTLGAPTDRIGSDLNEVRRQLLPLVISDPTLMSLVTANGEIRYTGLAMETNPGEQREGRMTLDFKITYPLFISEL